MQYFNRIFVFVIGVKQMIERMNRRLRSAPVSGIRRFTALAKAQPDCAMLTIGEPDFDTPAAIKASAVRALENGRTHYPMNAGDPDLRSAIAAFEAESRSLDYAPDEIIVTAGASEAIYVAMTGVLEPGALVVIEHAAAVQPNPGPGYRMTDQRKYRDTMITFYRYEEQQDGGTVDLSGQL